MEKPIKKLSEMSTNELIIVECEHLKNSLLDKNISYGDSLHSKGLLFDIETTTGIKGRINDKLRRIHTVGLNDETEDTLLDLMGYLVHLRIALIRKKENPQD